MLASLTQTGLAQLEAIFNSNIVNATPKMVKRNVEIIQQQILNKTNIQMPDSFFDLKNIDGVVYGRSPNRHKLFKDFRFRIAKNC